MQEWSSKRSRSDFTQQLVIMTLLGLPVFQPCEDLVRRWLHLPA
jgi:hypothetical protein